MRMQNYILTIISAALITLGCTQSFILEDNSTPAPKPTPTPELTSAPYAVGDYYNDGTKEGVVFEVWDNGNSGKIVSMTQSAEYLQWSSDEAEQKRLVGADNQTDGAANMAVIKAISEWEDKYPAFKWCADLGEGWYLPAKEELLTIYSNKAAIDANLTGQLSSSCYWSSTEYDYHDSDGVFCAWTVNMDFGSTYYYGKFNYDYVRAVSAFGNAKPTPELTSAPYAVGDYYNDGKKEGVVFEVWDNGNSGKIVSMTQSASTLQWSSDETEQKRFVGADNQTDGAVNMAIIKAISGWESKYPAFKWCADLGEGWYLPAKEELLTIYSNKAAIDANLTGQLSSSWYWSSTEYDYHNSDGVFCAWIVGMSGGYTSSLIKSSYYNYVRAVSAFGNAKPTPTPEPTLKTYAVGDYYNDGKKEGVVFEVTVDGKHGKIVSMTQSTNLRWANDTEKRRLIGADSETDGAVNMAVVTAVSGWESKYPAFKWCADLGEGWYLPAKKELLTIYSNKDLINANLTQQLLENWYWSSTEYDYHDSDGVFCAWLVDMLNGSTRSHSKYYYLYVRAVSAF